MTQERRKEIYAAVVANLRKVHDNGTRGGFCWYLHQQMTQDEKKEIPPLLTKDLKNTIRKSLQPFPEILKQEPEEWWNMYYWFKPYDDGVAKRIEVLNEIISKM